MHVQMMFFFIAVAAAAPQYYYNNQQQNGNNNGGSHRGFSSSSLAHGHSNPSYGSYPSHTGASYSSNSAGPSYASATSYGGSPSYTNRPSYGSSSSFHNGQRQQFNGQGQQFNQPTVYNKQIFIHSAPEDEFVFGPGSGNDNLFLKKNIRVVIVKSPENKGFTNAALQIAKSTTEDKTVVYVLNKQTDLGELQTQINQIQDGSQNKPEVHFITYKTPEEARHAENVIQAQYDAINGPTQVVDEGAASVDNYSSSGSNGASSANNFRSTSNVYLPSKQ